MTYREPGREMTADEQEERTSWLASVLEEYLRGAEVAALLRRANAPRKDFTDRLHQLVVNALHADRREGTAVFVERSARTRCSLVVLHRRGEDDLVLSVSDRLEHEEGWPELQELVLKWVRQVLP